MYIAPDSTVILLAGCPINATYENTLWFNNSQSQENYFKSLAYRTFSKVSYQRATSGQITLQVNPYSVLNCNYMMFQNRNFSTKWFYAFITNVEYVNNETARITYEIDVMQTWLFDAKLRQCFVEREHSATDVAGDNLVPEPIDLGPLVCHFTYGFGFENYAVVVSIAEADREVGQHGSGLYSPLQYVIFRENEIDNLNDYFNQIVQNNLQDSVVGVTIMPQRFLTSTGSIDPNYQYVAQKPTNIGGYIPRNKKLLTSPFCYLAVDCLNDVKTYQYEKFSSTDMAFNMYCYVSPEVQIVVYPLDYNGGANATEGLIMRGFPQLPFIVDSYRAWLAQNATSDMLSAVGSISGALGSALTGNIAGSVSAIVGFAQGINSMLIEQARGDRARGVQSGGADIASQTKDLYFKRMGVTVEFARIIDDYFDRYGYASLRNKIPATANRSVWNYVKTRDCSITGDAPQEALLKIADIYNNGVRFWLDSDVGNYNRPNPIRG